MFIEDFFKSEKIPAVIKWAVTIIVTGFIAQFGKRLADYIIKKVKGRRLPRTLEEVLPESKPEKDDTIIEESLDREKILKFDKKAFKAKQKRDKKLSKAKTKKLKKDK